MNTEKIANNIKIFKYPIRIADVQLVTMPDWCRILSCVSIGDFIYLYALVDQNEDVYRKRVIIIIGTGNPVRVAATNGVFLGTVVTHFGGLIWHVFDAGWEDRE